MKHKIVADSSCNLYMLPDVAFESVPLKIRSADREYLDNTELDIGEMVATLKAEKAAASTSCPNMMEWLDAFGDAEQVFAVAITSQLSGSYNAALQAAHDFKQEDSDRRIMVIDTLSAGPELQLIIEKLRECILAGGSFEQIRTTVRNYTKHTHLLFSLQSLDNFAKNGRCSMALAKMVGVLGIRVVGKASDQGTLEPLNKVRGEQKALESLLNELARGNFRGGKIRIAHCFNLKSAETLRKMILDCFPGSDIEIVSCGGLCSYYADLGGLLVAYEDGDM